MYYAGLMLVAVAPEQPEKIPVVIRTPPVAQWKEPWTRNVRRLWFTGRTTRELAILRGTPKGNATLEATLEVRRDGALVASREGLTISKAPWSVVNPGSEKFIVLLRPKATERGQRVAASVYEIPSLRETATIVPSHTFETHFATSVCDYVDVSQNGAYLAIATGHANLELGTTPERSLEIFALEGPKKVWELARFPGRNTRAHRIRFSPNGKRLVVLFADSDNRRFLQVFEGPEWSGSNVLSAGEGIGLPDWPVWESDLAFHFRQWRVAIKPAVIEATKAPFDDGSWTEGFFSGSALGIVNIDILNGTILNRGRTIARIGHVNFLAAPSPDGRELAVWTDDNWIGIWTLDAFQPRD